MSSIDNEIVPYCTKHKKILMIKKPGPYGEFWACPKYPKCKQTLSIPKEKKKKSFTFYSLSTDLTIYKLHHAENKKDLYQKFIETNAFKSILVEQEKDDITLYEKNSLAKIIEHIYNQNLETLIPSGADSALFGLMKKREKYHLAAMWAYFAFCLKGNLDNKMDFFLSPIHLPREKELQMAIKKHYQDYWLFDLLNINLVNFWKGIPEGEIDILGEDRTTGNPIVIELKRKKHKEGLGQAIRYKSMLVSRERKPTASYIIGLGWPKYFFDVHDDYINSIGLISYAIENNEILFIPWRTAKFMT